MFEGFEESKSEREGSGVARGHGNLRTIARLKQKVSNLQVSL